MANRLAELPDRARLWVFGADRALEPDDVGVIDRTLETFLAGWAAHGAALLAAHRVLDDRFVIVALDEASQGASGCSIDALSHCVGELERRLDVVLRDGAAVWYRAADGHIVSCDRATFRTRAEQGEIDEDTPVFDHTISTLADLRAGRFERPARTSWHARLLGSAGVPAGD